MPHAKIEVRSSRELRPPRRASRPKEDHVGQDDLRKSIARFGVLQPIVARRDGEVIIGQRRSEAARRLGLDVPVIFRDDLRDEVAALEARLGEELAHQPWGDLALAEEIRKLYEAYKERNKQFTQVKLADRLGVSPDKVGKYLALAGLPEEIKEKVSDQELSAHDAVQIGGIADLTEKEKTKLARKVVEGKIPGGRKLIAEVAPLIRKAPEDVREALIHHRDTTYEDARRHLARREVKEAKKATGAEHTLHGLAATIREQFRNWRGSLRGTRDVVPLFPENEWVNIEALILELVDELSAWRKARRDREEITKAKALIGARPERVIKIVEDRKERWVPLTEG